MQSLAKVMFLLLLIGLSTTCWANNNSVGVFGKALEIKASITPKFKNFDKNKSKIEGKITITNRTSTPQKYGNEFLQLKVNGKLVSRTYKQTVASEVIDFAVVEIKPRSSLSLPVYWVFDVARDTEIDSVQMYLDEAGIEKAQGITRP